MSSHSQLFQVKKQHIPLLNDNTCTFLAPRSSQTMCPVIQVSQAWLEAPEELQELGVHPLAGAPGISTSHSLEIPLQLHFGSALIHTCGGSHTTTSCTWIKPSPGFFWHLSSALPCSSGPWFPALRMSCTV